MPVVSVFLRAFLDFVYPPHCLLCRTSLENGESLCDLCRGELGVIQGTRCQRCGCPAEIERTLCENCRSKPFEFSQLIVLAFFNEHIRKLVHMLKYQGKTLPGNLLGQMLGQMLLGHPILEQDPLIVPVPLHASRKRERGYNQAEIIAHGVSKITNLVVNRQVLKRVRATQTQTQLGVSGRRDNVEGAFRIGKGAYLQDRVVLVLDDVVTTGATVNACARALLDAGAREVFAAAIASPYTQ